MAVRTAGINPPRARPARAISARNHCALKITTSVADAMMRLLDRPRLEIYPRYSESLLVRFATLFPNQLPRLMRLFRGKGRRGEQAYLRYLEAEGHVRRVGDGWELTCVVCTK